MLSLQRDDQPPVNPQNYPMHQHRKIPQGAPDAQTLVKKLLFLWLLLPAAASYGQGPINTDRPDQSTGVYTLAKNAFQLETGLLYGGVSASDYLLHNTMLRYGLFKKTEVRVSLDYGRQFGATGILPVNLSVKQALVAQNGVLPAITAIADLSLPFLASDPFRPANLPAGLTLAFENELSDHFSLTYNVGAFADGERDRPNWLVTTNIGYAPVAQVALFLEYFATYAGGVPPDHNADAGILWLLKDNLQLDLAAGTSLFRTAMENRYITVGFSYRFD